jgi:tripartite-type tricarboxylate transporter receptor subunit TctC
MTRFVWSAALVAASLLLTSAAAAQNYPVRTIRLIVHSAPAGTSDILGRIVAQKLTESLGQQVVVENRPGASGIIGVEAAVKSPPDGYTLLITQTSIAINPSMFKKLPYDALRDLAPVTQLVTGPNVLVVHPSVPATNVKGLVALARAKPGILVVGSPGSGTSPHLSAELFKVMAKVDMIQVQFKGAGLAIISLLSGEVGVMFPTPPTVMQYIKARKLRALGLTGANRIQALPEVPTIAEAGVPGYESTQWFGILVPAGTPRPIIDRLHQEITRSVRAPEMKEKLTAEGLEVIASTPAEFATHIKAETEKWARVIKAMGIKSE